MATKKQTTPEFGLCIDWETSGADFGRDSSLRYQGVSFGAIIFRTKDFSPVETLYREIKFNSGTVKNNFEWTESAQKIHGKSREYLQEKGVTMMEAATDLLEFIMKIWPPGEKVMFLGHNPEFDIRFTAQLFREINFEFAKEMTPSSDSFDGRIELHHVVLDTSALGFITLGLYKSDLLFEKIGGEGWQRGEHNALVDAEMTLQTCQALRQLVGVALEPV